MKRLAALLGLIAAGCGGDPPSEPPPGAIINEADKFVRDPGPEPLLVTYRVAERDVERPPLDQVAGVLDFTGPCVRIQDRAGAFKTLVTVSGARLLRDSLGWYFPSGRVRLRHGSSIGGAGLDLPALPPSERLAEPVPAACGTGPAIELISIRRALPDEPGLKPKQLD